jgi:hypothetical protein
MAFSFVVSAFREALVSRPPRCPARTPLCRPLETTGELMLRLGARPAPCVLDGFRLAYSTPSDKLRCGESRPQRGNLSEIEGFAARHAVQHRRGRSLPGGLSAIQVVVHLYELSLI